MLITEGSSPSSSLPVILPINLCKSDPVLGLLLVSGTTWVRCYPHSGGGRGVRQCLAHSGSSMWSATRRGFWSSRAGRWSTMLPCSRRGAQIRPLLLRQCRPGRSRKALIRGVLLPSVQDLPQQQGKSSSSRAGKGLGGVSETWGNRGEGEGSAIQGTRAPTGVSAGPALADTGTEVTPPAAPPACLRGGPAGMFCPRPGCLSGASPPPQRPRPRSLGGLVPKQEGAALGAP